MADFAKLTVEIDSRGVKRTRNELGRFTKGAGKAEKATGKLALAWKKYGALITGAVVVMGLRSIIKAAAEQEKTLAQLRAGLKSTAGVSGQTMKSLTDLSAEIQRTTVYSNEMVEAAEGILLSFTQISGEAFPRTIKAAADVATRMGTDLQPAIIQLGKALNDPVANLGALSRAGIQFTKDQKALIKELWETNRTAEAQKIVLDELETQYGDSARAAKDTLGGAIAGLRNEWDDFKKAIGVEIASPAKSVFETMIKMIKGTVLAAELLKNRVGNVAEYLAEKQVQVWMKSLTTNKEMIKARLEAEKASATQRLAAIEKSLLSEADVKKQALRAEYERNELFLHQQIQQHAEGTSERARLEEVYHQHMTKLRNKVPEEIEENGKKITESTEKKLSEMEKLTLQWGTSFIDTLFDAEARAEMTFESVASGFAKMVARMLAQQALLAAFGLPSRSSTPTAEAKGAAFSAGRIMPMGRGGVVTQPTLFPMAKGMGLMGEKPPGEAVMPLARTSSGKLGVEAVGAGAEVHVNIINNTGAAVTQQRRQSGQRVEIDVMIGEAVDREIKEGRFDRAFQSSFGIHRRGVR